MNIILLMMYLNGNPIGDATFFTDEECELRGEVWTAEMLRDDSTLKSSNLYYDCVEK